MKWENRLVGFPGASEREKVKLVNNGHKVSVK